MQVDTTIMSIIVTRIKFYYYSKRVKLQLKEICEKFKSFSI